MFRKSGMILIMILASGCYGYVDTYPAASVTVGTGGYVSQAPPPAPVVVQPAPPYAGAVWVDGYWSWSGQQYYWVPGQYVAPRQGYVYVQPRWQYYNRGWSFYGGGWRTHNASPYVRTYPHYNNGYNRGGYNGGYRRDYGRGGYNGGGNRGPRVQGRVNVGGHVQVR